MAGLHFDATYNNADVMRKVRECEKVFAELGNTAEIQGKRIDAAFEKISLKSLERAIEIMKNFPKEVQGISSFQKQIDGLEKHIERVNQRIASVGNGKLGSTFSDVSGNVNIGNVLKEQVYVGAQAVNTLSEKIIQQKVLIKDIEQDVRTLGEAYRRVGEGTTKGNALFADFKSAKKSLQEEKNALFELQTQQAQARLSVRKLKDEQSLYQKEAQKVVESNEKMSVSFKKALGVIGGTAMLKKFVSDVVRVRGEMQQLDVAFTTLLQSKEKANALMAQMVQTAAKTPFNLTELANGAKQLVAYGFASEGVNDTLIRLGNIAAGLGLPLERLTYLYGTTMTQGRLYARDLMQFTTSGIPMLQGLADMFGVSTDKVNEMVTAGKVGFPEVQKVIENMTNQGGKFFNLMEEQSGTITGKISNLGDSWAEMLDKIGQSQEGVINGSVDGLKYMIENYEKIGSILLSLIEIYGVYRTACIAHIVLTQSLGTTQIMLGATMAKLRSSFIALTASMNLNPLVLAATAIIGLGVVMWNLADNTDAATKAQNKLNDELDKFKQKEEERKQKTESLIRTIQDETETEFAKVKAYQELQRLSPTLTDAYKREELAVASLADTNKELNKVRDVESYDNIIANIDKYSRYVKELQSISGGWSSSTKSTSHLQMEYPNTNVSNAREQAIEDLKKWQEALDEYKRLKKEAEENDKPVKVKLLEAQDNREQILQEFLSAKMTLEEEQRKIQESGLGVIPIDVQIRFDNAKAQLSNIDKIIAALMQGNTTQTYKEAYNTAQREWKAAQKALVESKKKSKAEYIAAKKDLDNKEKAYKDLGGVTNSTNQDKAANKLREQQEKLALLMDKQALDQARSAEDLQNQVDQKRLDAMDEGSKKTLAQMELNFEKEMQAIDRQKEDLLRKKIEDERAEFDVKEDKKKAKDPKYIKQTFNPTSIVLSDGENKQFNELYKAQIESFEKDKQRQELEAMRDYLKEYGTFQQQKLAIAEEYAEKIKNAQNEGEVLKLEKERDTTIQNKETEAIKANIDWVTVFGEFGGMFNDMIKPTLEEAKKYVQTDKFRNSDQASQKTLIDAINQMEKSLSGAGGVNFKKLGQDVQIYQNALRSLNTAKEEEIEAINKLKKANEDYEKAVKNGTEQEKQAAKDAQDIAQQNADTASANVKAQTYITNQSQQDVTDTATGLKASMVNVTEGLNKLASGGIKNAYEGLIQASKGIGGAFEKVADKIEDVPIIGWIISIIDIFKDGLSNLVGPLLDSIFDAISGILSDVLSGDIFVTIGKSLRDGIGSILNSITWGGWNSWMDKINGSNAKEVNKTTERLTDSNERLKDSVDSLKDEMSKSGGWKAIDAAKQAKSDQEAINKQTNKILQEQMGYHDAHHSNAYYWGLDRRDYGSINNTLADYAKKNNKTASRVNGLDDMYKLTPEEMDYIRTYNIEMWEKMLEQGKYDKKEYWENYADLAGKLEEINEALKETLTQTSFDSLRDSFVDSLMDMDKSADDFANDFQEYMMRAILNAKISDLLDKDLQEFYDKWAKYAESDNKITEAEQEELSRDWDKLSKKGLDIRDQVASITGYDSSSDSDREASKKGFASMSQDSADELNGRFTVIQGHTYEINGSVKAIQSDTAKMAEKLSYLTNMDKTMSDMVRGNDVIISHLSNIEGYTSNLVDIRQFMYSMKLGIDTLNTKGLTLKR